jgi:hypothetical protein
MRFEAGRRRRRMIKGTIARTGGHTMRQGLCPGFAPQDCQTSRRSTVMCALPRVIAVTTEYQSDSSSKRPQASVVSAARPPTHRWHGAVVAATVEPSALDNRSFHISVRRSARAIRAPVASISRCRCRDSPSRPATITTRFENRSPLVSDSACSLQPVVCSLPSEC